jgi:hypothetical protein
MPADSAKQQKMIFTKRGIYGSKEKTPEKWKWIWDSGYEKVKEKITTKSQALDILLWRKRFGNRENTPPESQWIWDEDLSDVKENKMKTRYVKFFKEMADTIELHSGDKVKLRNGNVVTIKNDVGKYRFELVAIDKSGKEISINRQSIDSIVN